MQREMLLYYYRGLGNMVRRDCIREGDGPAIIANWKMDFPEFFSKGHPKYTIFCHKLLCGRFLIKSLKLQYNYGPIVIK